MKTLYYDCFCGISGDMNLGALIDLGVTPEHLLNELQKLNIHQEFNLIIERGMKNAISGTNVSVELLSSKAPKKRKPTAHSTNNPAPHNSSHINHESHCHDHAHHHGHKHDHNDPITPQTENQNHQGGTPHHHRSFTDIKALIAGSNLSDRVKEMSINMFAEVAKAEGKVHGKPADHVHFHEVGAVDSIIDIVGAAICLEALEVDQIMCSTVQLGGGFVNCAHGMFPIPAPATLEILQDVPIKAGAVQFETTTPTGAAILKANVDLFSDTYTLKVKKIGYGIGKRDLAIPNVLRVYLGEDLSGR